MKITRLFVQIRVMFVNELGVEEAGVDGGGIFKDFMEGITKTGFDVQYGLFKVCSVLSTLVYLPANFLMILKYHIIQNTLIY